MIKAQRLHLTLNPKDGTCITDIRLHLVIITGDTDKGTKSYNIDFVVMRE